MQRHRQGTLLLGEVPEEADRLLSSSTREALGEEHVGNLGDFAFAGLQRRHCQAIAKNLAGASAKWGRPLCAFRTYRRKITRKDNCASGLTAGTGHERGTGAWGILRKSNKRAA